MPSQEQTAWIARVLGVSLRPPSTARMPAGELLAQFRDAKEAVDSGITKLQAALRDTGDEDLVRVAEYGLYGMTGGQGVALMKALMELRTAPQDKQDAMAKAARQAATAYKAAVVEHALADLIDDNPFGVDVGIQARLGPVLDTIIRAA